MSVHKSIRLALLASALFGVTTALAVTVSVDKVQQRYPWNGIVDIDYTIALSPGEIPLAPTSEGLRFFFIDRTAGTTNNCFAFPQTLPSLATGSHRLAWDANADGVTAVSDDVEVRAELVHYPVRYLVIDVSGGPTAESYPVTWLDGEPAGGFNAEAYKTSQIVLRQIPPGSIRMGSTKASDPVRAVAERETAHNVTVSRSFCLGLFEVTQAQYRNVVGSVPVVNVGDLRPVGGVSYTDIRGATLGANWPTNNQVDATSFLGKLRTKTGLAFDLPTEAQWEYACRAGTDTPFNDGVLQADLGTYAASMDALGRYAGDVGDERGGYSVACTKVGSYAPNAWGLYDMHGNVTEWCLDWYVQDVPSLGQFADAVGPSVGTFRVVRGGYYGADTTTCRSAYRYCYDYSSNAPNGRADYFGFRLALHDCEGEVSK